MLLLVQLVFGFAVVLAPGALVARALGVRRLSATVAWALAVVFAALAVTFLVSKLADNTPWTFSVFNGGETFASRIANNAAEFDTPAKTGAYIAAGLVLFVLTFIVNAIARVVIERRKAFSE